jgi:hypothetical protein
VLHFAPEFTTYLGMSQGKPSGRAVGKEKAHTLATALRESRAFSTGLLEDISEAELFIWGVGRDTISDLTTNVLRGSLATYTKAQCDLFGIPTQKTASLGPVWKPNKSNWESQTLELPFHARRPVLLVPKFSVRRSLSLDSQEFYNHHMVEYLKAEYLQAGSALVEILKNGNRRVTKKSVKERHPFVKDHLGSRPIKVIPLQIEM